MASVPHDSEPHPHEPAHDSEQLLLELGREWNNFKNPLSGMDRYGEQRMRLAVLLRDNISALQQLPWTLENGSLLGAWRNCKLIPHDDDIDIAIFFEEDAKSQLPDLLEKIKVSLPSQYKARLVSSYTDKIEVFDPSHGCYTLQGPAYNGAYFHHVTVDIQPYQLDGDVYRSLYKNAPVVLQCRDVFPIGSITLEGEEFPAPQNVEVVLVSLYGSLSPKAVYIKELGKYVVPEEHTQHQ